MRGNLHTHTTFCDGKDTPEEMVLAAITLGCDTLGFSEHSHVPFDTEGGMAADAKPIYQAEILRLKEKYKDQICILLGVEQDYYSPTSTEGYEYIIGSVHYLHKDGKFLPVDLSRESFLQAAREHYAGDVYALCEDYYNTVAKVYEKTCCNIVGHFDLVTKFNEGNCLFDTAHPRYRAAAQRALDALCAASVTFEINYGAISRGYRTVPYPENWIVEILRERNVPMIETSDCHDQRYLLPEQIK